MQIDIYSKTDCPYCKLAKEYLDEKGVEYNAIVLDDFAERNAMYDSFGLTGKQRTVPQIVVTEAGVSERVGGYDKLIAGDLVERYNAAHCDEDF